MRSRIAQTKHFIQNVKTRQCDKKQLSGRSGKDMLMKNALNFRYYTFAKYAKAKNHSVPLICYVLAVVVLLFDS